MKENIIKNYISKLQYYYIRHRELPSTHTIEYILNISNDKIDNVIDYLKNLKIIKDGLFSDDILPGDDFFNFKVYRSIKAGTPFSLNADDYDVVKIDNFDFEFNPSSSVFARVAGDSMIDFGIQDSDIVALDVKKSAKNGDIVAAIVDGEYTLKKLINKNGETLLRAGNSKYNDIIAKEELSIAGVYINKVSI